MNGLGTAITRYDGANVWITLTQLGPERVGAVLMLREALEYCIRPSAATEVLAIRAAQRGVDRCCNFQMHRCDEAVAKRLLDPTPSRWSRTNRNILSSKLLNYLRTGPTRMIFLDLVRGMDYWAIFRDRTWTPSPRAIHSLLSTAIWFLEALFDNNMALVDVTFLQPLRLIDPPNKRDEGLLVLQDWMDNPNVPTDWPAPGSKGELAARFALFRVFLDELSRRMLEVV